MLLFVLWDSVSCMLYLDLEGFCFKFPNSL